MKKLHFFAPIAVLLSMHTAVFNNVPDINDPVTKDDFIRYKSTFILNNEFFHDSPAAKRIKEWDDLCREVKSEKKNLEYSLSCKKFYRLFRTFNTEDSSTKGHGISRSELNQMLDKDIKIFDSLNQKYLNTLQ